MGSRGGGPLAPLPTLSSAPRVPWAVAAEQMHLQTLTRARSPRRGRESSFPGLAHAVAGGQSPCREAGLRHRVLVPASPHAPSPFRMGVWRTTGVQRNQKQLFSWVPSAVFSCDMK